MATMGLNKVGVSISNTTIILTPIFEQYVIRCESKNWHQKDMCLEETGLHAQNMLIIILSSVVNMIEWAYMTT